MKSKKIVSIVMIALAVQVAISSNTYASVLSVNEDKLIGKNRYETAIEVSRKGWPNGAINAVLVNDNSIVDALSATPFANAKDAPILLTQKDSLNEKTKQYLKELGVKNVYIIGGDGVISKKVEEELRAENISIDRIQGKNREATAIEIAKRLDEINPVTEISLVNGYNGLADAVSIAAVSANENMPIILSRMDNISEDVTEFINDNSINKTYIVGGEGVVSNNLEKELPNATRISGQNRQETNAEVIKTFFTQENIDNLYIAKDGAQSEDQLIDALSVGSLAAKTNSPVMIVGKTLSESQKDLISNKSFNTITQVGGSGNENAFNDIKNIQNEIIASKPSMDETKVDFVKESIDNLKEVESITLGDEDRINEVREAYDALNEEEKALVTNYNKLQQCEAEFKRTYKAIHDVSTLIHCLPSVDNLTLDDKSKVEEARAAYDALLDKEQYYVIAFKHSITLEKAEEKIAELEKASVENTKPDEDISTPEEETPVNPDSTTLYKYIVGSNDKGLGDTTYDELKKQGWEVESDNVLSIYNGRVKFENLNGKNNEDAKVIIKCGDDKVEKAALKVLTLMNGVESQYSPEKLREIINHGTSTIKDGSRYIDIKYDGNIFFTITVTFSNFGITPVHEAIEGSNKNGFADTTYEELKDCGWTVDSDNKVSSNRGNVSFTNVDGVDNIDCILEVLNVFDKSDEDLLYALSLMLNSRLKAEELASTIQEEYDKGSEKMVIGTKNCTVIVDFTEKGNIKITFKNIYDSI